jgi:protein MAK11
MQDCKPKAKILPFPRTKLHQMHYLPIDGRNILSLSTEDGRVLFYSTLDFDPDSKGDGDSERGLPSCLLVGQLGGAATGFPNRIKDYSIIALPGNDQGTKSQTTLFIITAGSDGAIRLWAVEKEEFLEPATPENQDGNVKDIPQVGRLLGTYETSNRITCLKSFVLIGEPEDNDAMNEAEESGEDGSEMISEDSE